MSSSVPDLESQGKHHHRNVHGGAARAAVFGASDGLVSNVSLILGVAGADSSQEFVRLVGIAGLVAGAISMAAGEYLSMKAQQELFERELDMERREIARNPEVEVIELSQLYESRGFDPELATEMASHIMRDPELALEVHAREELGINPNELGNPIQAAASSFVTFSAGAILPLLPWFFTGGRAAMVGSILLGLFGAICVGVALAKATGRPMARPVIRQVSIATFAAGSTFLIGSLVGAGVG